MSSGGFSGCTHDHIQFESKTKVSADAVDYSDPEIKEMRDKVMKNDPSVNWMILTYVGASNKLKVSASGDDGLKGMCDELNEGKASYCLVRVSTGKNNDKIVYITWAPDGIPATRRGLFHTHAPDVARFFNGFNLQINARNEDDVKEATVIDRCNKVSASGYRV